MGIAEFYAAQGGEGRALLVHEKGGTRPEPPGQLFELRADLG
jgi:hypothetical protein